MSEKLSASKALDLLEEVIDAKTRKMIITQTTDDPFAIGYYAGLSLALKAIKNVRKDHSLESSSETNE